jgi:hypothetical protein
MSPVTSTATLPNRSLLLSTLKAAPDASSFVVPLNIALPILLAPPPTRTEPASNADSTNISLIRSFLVLVWNLICQWNLW